MVQLWVNLRAKDKTANAGYQTLLKAQIPDVPIPQDAGTVRVIAGEYGGQKGPAKTFTPINLWDVNLRAGKSVELPLDARIGVLPTFGGGFTPVSGCDTVRNRRSALRFGSGGVSWRHGHGDNVQDIDWFIQGAAATMW